MKVGIGLSCNGASEMSEQIQREDFHRVPKSLVSLVKHLHKSYFIIIKEMHDLILKLFH